MNELESHLTDLTAAALQHLHGLVDSLRPSFTRALCCPIVSHRSGALELDKDVDSKVDDSPPVAAFVKATIVVQRMDAPALADMFHEVVAGTVRRVLLPALAHGNLADGLRQFQVISAMIYFAILGLDLPINCALLHHRSHTACC